MDAVRAMKVQAAVIPSPKPPGKMKREETRDSGSVCHVRMRRV
jgi:hypothetical protein